VLLSQHLASKSVEARERALAAARRCTVAAMAAGRLPRNG